MQLAVADQDVPKDTNNTIEVLARMLETIYERHRGLPQSVYVVLDNTSRENKNNIMLKFWAQLVLLGVFRTVMLSGSPCSPFRRAHFFIDAGS